MRSRAREGATDERGPTGRRAGRHWSGPGLSARGRASVGVGLRCGLSGESGAFVGLLGRAGPAKREGRRARAGLSTTGHPRIGLRKREGRGVGRRGLLGQEGRGKGGGGLGHFGFWAGCWVWFLSFGSLFLFLIQTKFEFKYKFESKPHSNKNMHQHECNTKIKPRQILITCETKLN